MNEIPYPEDPAVFSKLVMAAWQLIWDMCRINKMPTWAVAAACMKASVEIYATTGLTKEEFMQMNENVWNLAKESIQEARVGKWQE